MSSLFALLACPFSPPPPQTMLCRNCCNLGEQTNNIEWGSGVFSEFFFAIKRVVLVDAPIVPWKDIVSANYVAVFLRPICCVFAIGVWEKTTNLSDLVQCSTQETEMT